MRRSACAGWFLSVSLLVGCSRCEEVFGILGENFTFPVKTDQKIGEIIWTKNKDKVAEWEGQTETTYFGSLQDRGLLNKDNGCLTIFNLENSDTGTYTLHMDMDSTRESYEFTLTVLAPPSEPEISCNVSGDNLVLRCIAHFQKPLTYTWNFTSGSVAHQTQEVSIPKNVDASEKAACFVKFSQTEKSSVISLTQCFPAKKAVKRERGGLIAAFVSLILVVGILLFLYRKATSSQTVDYENEKPGADKELNEEYSVLKPKQTVNNDANQEDICKENSSLLAQHADDHGVDAGGVAQDVEGGNGEQLSNSPSCSKEGFKS